MKNNYELLESLLLDMPDETMTIEEFDGFAAGIVVCPEFIPPSKWLPFVWSKNGNFEEAPEWANADEAYLANSMLMDRYNMIAGSLLPGMSNFEVTFSVFGAHEEIIWELWAIGFGRALLLSPEAWLQYTKVSTSEAALTLAKLIVLVDIAQNRSNLSKSEIKAFSDEAPSFIPNAIQKLSYWRLAHNPVFPITRSAAFQGIGRNAPCPCGSGKKYKKCHGSPIEKPFEPN